ncbi:glycoside hydrolase family 127 protein [Aureibacillus halotolerans]|uniref:Glycoside hydrolase family 127 protein n=1 Tax=Aureibacillus halotolerans TaxID=1508390 RepID=A0A4R6U2X8_9BACI|nr:beta-L-arabinofuranosidase domain-containing protein [Aureibacillus halotolerans]TDQ37464.1 hypothetical protein EV213_11399 [Aureibacillus halotolerans]
MNKKLALYHPKVRVTDSFWREKIDVVKTNVIPYQWEALNDRLPDAAPSHAIENLKIAAGEKEGEYHGFVFQDTDLAKWIEAVAYVLEDQADETLEAQADEVIDLVVRAQGSDGYLNTYFTVKEPGKRWTNLRDQHELYTAGHFIEAAVAYYQATGKDVLLKAMCRFVDYIDSVFGLEEDKRKGYDGHQEIELALLRLYEVTGDEKHLNLSYYFINQRGQQPHYFDIEKEEREENSGTHMWKDVGRYGYSQAHKPVREQDEAVGHAVRAVYMYSAMADLAKLKSDEGLAEATKTLWKNVTNKQMYLTAGIGSQTHGEAFSTIAYDLPNDECYTETCASIGLVFWAQRMMKLEKQGAYGDVMERALYNGTISGMDLNGKRFFYVNPLEVWPEQSNRRENRSHAKPVRQKWYSCACCPPNLARLIASIGRYMYEVEEDYVYNQLFMSAEATVRVKETDVILKQKTNYPWEGHIATEVHPEQELSWTFAVRIPGWAEGAELYVNAQRLDIASILHNGYALIDRVWRKGDVVELKLPLTPQRVYAHPSLRENAGKVAFQRGPVVYAFEEADNGKNLPALSISPSSVAEAAFEPDILDGVVALTVEGHRAVPNDEGLYQKTKAEETLVQLKAVPYYAWCNREPGEMLVWVREKA